MLEHLPPLPKADMELSELVTRAANRPRIPSRELFSEKGEFLACWQPGDVGLHDDWLTSPENYPFYHALFTEAISSLNPPVRMLEIGVRSGYIGVVFARSTHLECTYYGIDPNLYLPNGLKLANKALRSITTTHSHFNYRLIKGYSHDTEIRRQLYSMPKFDIIHIDGDHSLKGKIADLDLCRKLMAPNGLTFVDDFYHMESVPSAIRCALNLGWYKRFTTAPTKRGLAILA